MAIDFLVLSPGVRVYRKLCANFIEDTVGLYPAILAPLTRKHSFIPLFYFYESASALLFGGRKLSASEICKLEFKSLYFCFCLILFSLVFCRPALR